MKEKLINNKINVDDAISVLRQNLIKISETSSKKVRFANNKADRKNQRKMIEWFDEECRYAKSKVNKKRKSFREALRNGENANYDIGKLKTEYFSELKEFNSLKARKENDYWRMKKANLRLLN